MLRQLTERAGFALLAARPVRPVPLRLDGTTSLTCVMRLPEPLADSISSTVRGWPGAEAHHVYPATSLHLTVLNLANVDGDVEVLSRIRDIVQQTAPPSLRLQGFRVTSHSVHLRVRDRDGGLDELRRGLIAETGGRPPWHLRRLAFVNVLRYASVPDDALLRAARATPFRPVDLVIDRAEIVRTDRLFSSSATTVLADLPLTGWRLRP